MSKFTFGLAALLAGVVCASASRASQPLETETARIGEPGTVKLEAGLEHQTAPDGKETDLPLALEVVATSRLELLLEPVAYTDIRDGSIAHGVGDLEATALYLVSGETRTWPAVAVAGEVKFPTARNRLIGSGKTDYAGYLVLSRRVAAFDLHGNLGYTIIGKPASITTHNVFSGALAVERAFGHFDVVAEALGNTAALAEGESGTNGESTLAPEIGGAEVVGTLGARYHLGEAIVASAGVSVDNNHAVQVHPGLTVRFR